ncbi:MAG: hypothetical protein GF344_19355 [Chitinivibrionales bacterium]|nr:hypothetical protein [Chitinivibrionales bacterium]MBD3358782.1 hypothetical protein [Chitinivibrionales bacterium]
MDSIPNVELARCLCEELSDRISEVDEGLLAVYPADAYPDLLDENAQRHSYSYLPPAAETIEKAIEERVGPEGRANYHKLVLAILIRDKDESVCPLRLPSSIRILIEETKRRILGDVEKQAADSFRLGHEPFVKSFALCRYRLLPCGSEFVEYSDGIARNTLLKGGAGQLFGGLWFFIRRGLRFRPWVAAHWDRRLFRQFNPADFDRTYERIVELLELNTHLQGHIGASWWYDPALESLSPEIAFLRKVPEQHGAALFRVGENDAATKDAVRLAPKRSKARREGWYNPTVYLSAWARQDMIRWMKKRGK